MNFIFNATLLITNIFALLTIEEIAELARTPIEVDTGSVYINPEGPLNILWGYIWHKSDLIHNKRLLSPCIKINYKLAPAKSESIFTINNSFDVVTTFEGSRGIPQYLANYHLALKTIFTAVRGEVNVHTLRDQSFCKFLRSKLDKNTCMLFLASLLLISEGVPVPLVLKDRRTVFNNAQINTKVLTCQSADDSPLFEIEMYDILRKPVIYNQDGTITDAKYVFHEYSDVRNLLKLFISCGGSNRRKLNGLYLSFSDKPDFLIKCYLFEFFRTINEAKLFLNAATKILRYVNAEEEHRNLWNSFFVDNESEIDVYKPVYDTYQAINRIVTGISFPFSAYCPPPCSVSVIGYDRKNRRIATNLALEFSDCCDITIYALLCCLLYNPATGEYSLDHLEKKGYIPSQDTLHFFTEVCPRPAEHTTHGLHQEWAKVVQDLVLTTAELRGEEILTGDPVDNAIVYRKEHNGVYAEIKSEILNALKVMAKILGIPSDKMAALNEIDSVIQNEDELIESTKNFIERFLKDISIMPIKITFVNFHQQNEDSHRRIYGALEILFNHNKSDGTVQADPHAMHFSFNSGHASAKILSRMNEISRRNKQLLDEMIGSCEKIGASLGPAVAESARNLVGLSQFRLIPSELVRRIESAENDMERYSAINELLMARPIKTLNDKMYVIDLFGPYLEKMVIASSGDKSAIEDDAVRDSSTNGDSNDKIIPITQPINNLSLKPNITANDSNTGHQLECNSLINYPLRPSDPLIQLITNIIGSVPLNDELTQYCFIQILAFCHGSRGTLFPNIQSHIDILPELVATDLCRAKTYKYPLFCQLSRFCAPNILYRLYRKIRAEHSETIFKEMEKHSLLAEPYYFMVRECARAGHFDGIEAAKRDFKIKEGVMQPGTHAALRLMVWFLISSQVDYYEGLEIACDSWGAIPKDDDFYLIKTRSKYAEMHGIGLNWPLMSDDDRDELCSDPIRASSLLQIYFYFALNSQQLDELYDLFVSHYSVALCNTLKKCIKNIAENGLSEPLGNSNGRTHATVTLFTTGLEYVRGLIVFIENISDFLGNDNDFDTLLKIVKEEKRLIEASCRSVFENSTSDYEDESDD